MSLDILQEGAEPAKEASLPPDVFGAMDAVSEAKVSVQPAAQQKKQLLDTNTYDVVKMLEQKPAATTKEIKNENANKDSDFPF